jgi:hypothetical protein
MPHALAGPFEQMPGIGELGTFAELQIYMVLAGHDAANQAVLEVTRHAPTDPFFNVRRGCSDNLPWRRYDLTVRLT